MNWQPIETAPKGSGKDGPQDTRDPAYVEPPYLLIWSKEGAFVGSYEWYYHPGYGFGAENGEPAWRSRDGEPIYEATHWMPLPEPPNE